MADCRHDNHRGAAHTGWPWEPEPRDVRRWRTRIRGGAWPLLVATVAVLAGGYGWLGSVAGGTLGALVGCAAGLVAGALLYLLVDSAVSGNPIRHRSVRRTSRRPAR